MAESAVKNIGRWAAGALCALAIALAHAQPPHGHVAFFGAPSGARLTAERAWHPPTRPIAGPPSRRAEHPFVMTINPYAHAGARFAPSPAIANAAVPLRPVSDEARALPRDGGAAAGSLRADIARYNEERGANRPARRPPPEHMPRPPNRPAVYGN